MKIAVFSDSHGSIAPMARALRQNDVDLVVHLGDHDADAELLHRQFPDIPLYSVRGNCDSGSDTPETLLVPLGPVRALLTHGHRHAVNRGLDTLAYAAEEAGAQLALFGHTHRAFWGELGGVRLLNPGSAGRGARPSWALLEIGGDGEMKCGIFNL